MSTSIMARTCTGVVKSIDDDCKDGEHNQHPGEEDRPSSWRCSPSCTVVKDVVKHEECEEEEEAVMPARSCAAATTISSRPPAKNRRPIMVIPLLSVLRPRSAAEVNNEKVGSTRRRPRSERRVRGLWSNEILTSSSRRPDENQFARLHDDTLIRIFSHVNVLDEACGSSLPRVCQRWKHVLNSNEYKDSIRTLDATDLVRRVHDQHCKQRMPLSYNSTTPPEEITSRLVEHQIAQYRHVTRLTIRDIGHRLTSMSYVPNLQKLTELTLTRFDDLTDLRLHALLLSSTACASGGDHSALPRRGLAATTSLQTLRLEHCPLLTCESVRSIALTCPHLRVLSLRGCRSVNTIVPLRNLWKISTTAAAVDPVARQSSSTIKNLKAVNEPLSLLGLFAASSATTTADGAVAAARSTSRPRRPRNDFESLFDAVAVPPPSPTSVVRGPPSYADRDVDFDDEHEAHDQVASGLLSLFAPPPTSRPHDGDILANLHPRSGTVIGPSRYGGSSGGVGGALIDVDVSDTGMSPEAVLEALSSCGGRWDDPKVHLERFLAAAHSDHMWTPRHAAEFENLVDVARLRETDILIPETPIQLRTPATNG